MDSKTRAFEAENFVENHRAYFDLVVSKTRHIIKHRL